MTKRIAIVGGGYAGIDLARRLEDAANVTLIEQRSHFVHEPALIRAVVDPAIIDQALMPYDKLLSKGEFVCAQAISVDESGVALADGSFIDADIIVVATGSENAMPFRAKGDSVEGLRAANAESHKKLCMAETIAIVGAGAVGVELAGEIKSAMPKKAVSLISGGSLLFPDKPAKFGVKVLKKLQSAGVDVLSGVRAENLVTTTEPYVGSLRLSDGTEIDADLIFPAIGSRAVSSLLENLPGAQKTSANRITTDSWMRPSKLENLFAAGDAIDVGDDMTIVATTRQVPWLQKTLLAVLKGKRLETLKPYRPWGKAPILIPLGPTTGHSYLGILTAGDFLTSKMKGKDMFLPRINKMLGRAG